MSERYVAEWCIKQHIDELGEWVPDRDEYESTPCKTLASAKSLAVRQGKKAGVCEYAAVIHERLVPGYKTLHEEIAHYSGDWSGHWEYRSYEE